MKGKWVMARNRLLRCISLGLIVSWGLLFLVVPKSSGLQFYFFFESPASEGGMDGKYFTGTPGNKLYDCRICHVDSPGKIRIHLRTEPEDIFLTGYQPGVTYTMWLELEEELMGPPFKLFSSNNFCLEVQDASGSNAGTFDPGSGWNYLGQILDPVVFSPDRTVVLSGFLNPELSWQWSWTAPPAGTGRLTVYAGFVDGNGDVKAFGDDVAVLRKTVRERP